MASNTASNRKSVPVLIFGFGAILAMMVGMVLTGLAHLDGMQAARFTLADIREKVLTAHEMHEAIQRRSFSLTKARSLEDFFDRDDEQQQFNSYARDFIAALERIEDLGMGPEERAALDEFYRAVRAGRPQVEAAMAAIVNGEAERSELDAIIDRAVEDQSQVIRALDRFVEVQKRLARDGVREVGESATHSRTLLMFFGGLIALASLIIAFYVIRRERWHTDALMVEIGDREKVENAIRDLNTSLEHRVAERTRELTEQMAERKKMAERLLESELRHRVTIDTAPNAIITIDGDGLIESFNPAAERIFGYSMGEMIGKNVGNLMPPPYRDDHGAYMANFQRIGENRIIGVGRDLLGQRKNGSVFPIRLAINDMEIDGRRRFVGIIEDITERKQVEQDLRTAKEQAELANDAKSNFLASMSHELRTPMNAILGFAQMLVLNPKEKLSAKQDEYVGDILSSGEHLMALISQVLELSKIDAGNLELSLERVDPKAAIDDALHMIEARAASRRIVIIREYAVDSPAGIITDGLRFKQVLLNLLSNAVKYNDERGRITVGCRLVSERAVRITVTDTGEGVSPDRFEELFQPFNRLGKEAGQVEGAGIGLAIAKDLVEALGGRIGCDSELGVGSTFWFELPTGVEVESVPGFGTELTGQSESTGKSAEEVEA